MAIWRYITRPSGSELRFEKDMIYYNFLNVDSKFAKYNYQKFYKIRLRGFKKTEIFSIMNIEIITYFKIIIKDFLFFLKHSVLESPME